MVMPSVRPGLRATTQDPCFSAAQSRHPGPAGMPEMDPAYRCKASSLIDVSHRRCVGGCRHNVCDRDGISRFSCAATI